MTLASLRSAGVVRGTGEGDGDVECGWLELDSDRIGFAYFGPHWASRLCWAAYPGLMKNGMQNGISQ